LLKNIIKAQYTLFAYHGSHKKFHIFLMIFPLERRQIIFPAIEEHKYCLADAPQAGML